MKVGIIGAGIAGLTAAYELGKKGHKVIVYEKAPFIGGHASSFDIEGERLERGYHHLFVSDTDILQLMDEIGLEDRVVWLDSSVASLCNGKMLSLIHI